MLQPTLIIAEAGVNHNGNLSLAKELIVAAAEAGADFVKFQTFKAEKIVSRSAQQAAYQIKNSGENSGQFAMLKKLELDIEAHNILIEEATKNDIKFLSTAFDLESIELLEELQPHLWKIPSGEITNLPYLQSIGRRKQDIIMSTGMCTLQEVAEALNVLVDSGAKKEQITILHCNTEYPTPFIDVNLRAMQTLAEEFQVNIGYSDHTLGIEVPVAAVAMGATCIEKHFTLSRTMPGPDHKASLEPKELTEMVSMIRNIELALGSTEKKPSPSEQKNIAIARKSIHLHKDIPTGKKIEADDLIMLRPGDGISPMSMKDIIGKELKESRPSGHKLSLEDIV